MSAVLSPEARSTAPATTPEPDTAELKILRELTAETRHGSSRV